MSLMGTYLRCSTLSQVMKLHSAIHSHFLLSLFWGCGGGVFIVKATLSVSFTQGKGIIESIQLGGGGHSS